MTYRLRRSSLALLSLGCFSTIARAQSQPADTGAVTAPGVGFSLPRVGGSVSYALNASELVSTGFYNSGTNFSTSLSGDVAYVSKSQRHPFSAIYDGGVLLANSSQPTTFFQSLSFSQVLSTKHWNIVLADTVNYLPESPLGGLSGIPGVGDLGVDPVAVASTGGLGILTTYGPRVSNATSGTVSRSITGKISAQGTGIFDVQHFIGANSDQGLNSTTEGGSLGLNYHFSARNTVTGSYNYTHFDYSNEIPGYTTGGFGSTTQGATIDFNRQWSRRLVTDVYAGPQVISGSNPILHGTSVQIAAGASVSYLSRTTSYSLNYNRGVNNGSGVIPGAFSDNLALTAHRNFGREWTVSGDVDFSRSVSLPNIEIIAFDSKGVSFGLQGNRRLSRSLSGFAEYEVQDQSVNSTNNLGITGLNAFNGVYQVFGIGISYSPRSLLLGR